MGKIMFFWLTLAYLLRLVKDDEIVSVTDIDTDLNLWREKCNPTKKEWLSVIYKNMWTTPNIDKNPLNVHTHP